MTPPDDRWYLGSDGLYHWVDCWLIGHCGHLNFYGKAKKPSELASSECCFNCLIAFFDAVVCKPFNQPEEVTA